MSDGMPESTRSARCLIRHRELKTPVVIENKPGANQIVGVAPAEAAFRDAESEAVAAELVLLGMADRGVGYRDMHGTAAELE